MSEKIVKRRLADGTVKEYRYARSGKAKVLTLQHVIDEYHRSPEFQQLARRSKVIYERALGMMEPFYAVAITDIKRRTVIGHRDLYADKPALANQLLMVWGIVLKFAVEREYIPFHPALRIKQLKTGEFARWPDSAIEHAMATLPEHLRRAVVVALYTGQRAGDCIAMQWADYDGAGIRVRQEKTGAPLWVPCHAALRAELDAWRQEPRTSTHILTRATGRPWGSSDSFYNMSSRALREDPAFNGLVFHGLRKTAAAKLAEAGCTTHEIAAITGHATLEMLQHYTREAEQKTRATAAILKLENARENGGKRRG